MPSAQKATIHATRVPTLGAIVKEARPRQMLKNGIVLVPLFFTINIWYTTDDVVGMTAIIAKALVATGIFMLLSAGVYYVNDSLDISKDRTHPQKRLRPIASGQISIRWAVGISIVIIIGALAGAAVTSPPMLITACAYLGINILYSWWIKNLAVLDVMAVSTGFVLRAVAGSIAIDHSVIVRSGSTIGLDLTISPWLYVVTALGALFLALAKRRGELFSTGNSSTQQKTIQSNYSLPLLDNLINVAATSTLISYTFYTFSTGVTEANVPANNSMMLTIPFVAYGVLRYLYLVHAKGRGESPEDILVEDWPLRINIALWIATGSSVLMWTRFVN